MSGISHATALRSGMRSRTRCAEGSSTREGWGLMQSPADPTPPATDPMPHPLSLLQSRDELPAPCAASRGQAPSPQNNREKPQLLSALTLYKHLQNPTNPTDPPPALPRPGFKITKSRVCLPESNQILPICSHTAERNLAGEERTLSRSAPSREGFCSAAICSANPGTEVTFSLRVENVLSESRA